MSKVLKGSADMHHMVGFTVGGGEYCVDILKVQEIIRLMEITRIPSAPDYAEGVINLRGKVIPVIDFRKRFCLQDEFLGDCEARRIVVVDVDGKTVGLIVDQVSHVIKLESDRISQTPDTVKGTGCGCFNSIGRHGERLIILLDVEAMFDEGELDWTSEVA